MHWQTRLRSRSRVAVQAPVFSGALVVSPAGAPSVDSRHAPPYAPALRPSPAPQPCASRTVHSSPSPASTNLTSINRPTHSTLATHISKTVALSSRVF